MFEIFKIKLNIDASTLMQLSSLSVCIEWMHVYRSVVRVQSDEINQSFSLVDGASLGEVLLEFSLALYVKLQEMKVVLMLHRGVSKLVQKHSTSEVDGNRVSLAIVEEPSSECHYEYFINLL